MSLNQELKDFLGGWSATTKIQGAYDDRAYKRARTAHINQQLQDMMDPELRGLKRDRLRAETERLRGLTDYYRSGSNRGADPYSDMNRPAPGSTPAAAPPAQPGMSMDNTSAPTMDTADLQPDYQPDDMGGGVPTAMAGSGGLITKPKLKGKVKTKAIQHFEDGGLVGSSDEDEDDEADATDPSQTPHMRGLSVEAGHDAAMHGIHQAQLDHGLHHPAGLRQPGNVSGYLRGNGAAGPMLTKAVLDKVDPDRKMGESERNMAGLSAVWQYHINKGEPEKARRAAAALMQQYRINAGHYSALAAAAANGGNIDAATHFATKAYANIPTGKDIKFSRADNGQILVEATDEKTGKKINRKLVTPQELGAFHLGRKPEDYDRELAEMAGMRLKEKKEEKPPSGEKAKEVGDRGALINKALPDAEEGKSADPDLKTKRSITDSLMRANKGSAEDAAEFAHNLLNPDANFSKREGKGGAYYKAKGGREMFVPDDVIARATELRLSKAPESDVPIGQSVDRSEYDADKNKPGVLEELQETIAKNKPKPKKIKAIEEFPSDYERPEPTPAPRPNYPVTPPPERGRGGFLGGVGGPRAVEE